MKKLWSTTSGSGNSFGGEMSVQDPAIRRSHIGEASINFALAAIEIGLANSSTLPNNVEMFVSPYERVYKSLSSHSLGQTLTNASQESLQKENSAPKQAVTYVVAGQNRQNAVSLKSSNPVNVINDELYAKQLAVAAAYDSERPIGDIVEEQLNPNSELLSYEETDPSRGAI